MLRNPHRSRFRCFYLFSAGQPNSAAPGGADYVYQPAGQSWEEFADGATAPQRGLLTVQEYSRQANFRNIQHSVPDGNLQHFQPREFLSAAESFRDLYAGVRSNAVDAAVGSRSDRHHSHNVPPDSIWAEVYLVRTFPCEDGSLRRMGPNDHHL